GEEIRRPAAPRSVLVELGAAPPEAEGLVAAVRRLVGHLERPARAVAGGDLELGGRPHLARELIGDQRGLPLEVRLGHALRVEAQGRHVEAAEPEEDDAADRETDDQLDEREAAVVHDGLTSTVSSVTVS